MFKCALLKDGVLCYILRHGTTSANKKDEFRGWEEFELDEQGINEAHEAAEWFLAHKVKPTRIISSPLARAKKTADIIGSALGVSVETDDRLKPLHVGDYTGKDKEKEWEDFVRYLDNPDEVIPGGESVNGFADRDCEVLEEILTEAAENGPIIIVDHTSNVVVADCYLKTGEVGMDCRPEEKDIVAPGGIVAISATRELTPVFKDAKAEEEKEEPEKAEHEEYDDKKQAATNVAFLFHGTTDESVERILEKGIILASSFWGTERMATYYAEDVAIEEGAEPVIFRVPFNRFNQASFLPDMAIVSEPMTSDYAPDLTDKSDEELYALWEASEGTWQDCLRIYEAVKYTVPVKVTKADIWSERGFE
jgi:broad specificity phosphatase PhoE